MKRLNYLLLAGIVLIAGVGGWVITQWIIVNAYNPIVMTPLLSILFFGVAVYLFVQGRQVLKLKRRERTRMTPLGAFRVVVMSHSGAYTASLFLGLLTSQIWIGAAHWEIPLLRTNALYAGLNALGALALLIVSIIVERWCVIDDDENSNDQVSHPRPMNVPRRATSRSDSLLP
ncbi:DUF3180 family protein [Boudabousia marimammalium]|uniref:DUF3180 domain-containing protein n=1 Tax=Boudabousia marimammalium TaxID=156892 RepID=A0A1Q5PMD5_9ACTO|nr:DUF3180 family protein [Boudabousia marimammalium]OKL48696.1 hypothetical protein BM477_05740 [Boudabousia marimammalium]